MSISEVSHLRNRRW